jgi:predicted translation initiation factor SUI1
MTKRTDKTVLFLCTGNYYRSRFAEILFNSAAGKMGLSWRASSRALALERGFGNRGPMSVLAIATLKSMGVRADDAFARHPVQATADDFEQAELIVALKQAEHLQMVQERFPAWVEKIEYWHIDDNPTVLPSIEREVMGLVARLLGGTSSAPEPVPEKATPIADKPVTVKVGRETKGRRGKGVTTVFDVPLDETDLLELAATLKQKCGTGGTVKDGRIEIQGDQRERLVAVLESLGFSVKRVGG